MIFNNLAINITALRENQAKIDRLVDTISNGIVSNDLLEMMSKKATKLREERTILLAEQQKFQDTLKPIHSGINPKTSGVNW